MALPVEDEERNSQGSIAQGSSKDSHVTRDVSPVVYSYKMAEQVGDKICGNAVEESTLGMEVEDRSAKDGEGRGLSIGEEEENGNPEREEGTAEEVVSQLKSTGRRKMEDGGAEVAGSTKGEQDSAKSVEEKGKDEEVSQEEKKKKALPKRKRRRRPRRQAEAQHGAVMNSGVCCWNINMETLQKILEKVALLLFVFAICMPITECKPVMDETMLNVRMCAVYNDPSCPALTAIYWINGTKDIQLWKKDMPTCKDLEPCVPCRDDGRVIVRFDEVCKMIDMEGCGHRIDYEVTVCPRFGNLQDVQDQISRSHATTTPPPDKNTKVWETMLNVRMCAVYNDPSCPALTAIYWINGTKDIQLWKKDMPTCKDLEPCVPCRDDGRVIVRFDEVCKKIDMEGCGHRVDCEVTVCPRFGNLQDVQDQISRSHATTTPPPDKNTKVWVPTVVGVLGVAILGAAIYWFVKRRNPKGKAQNKEEPY
ncbi:uncharacterized protein LOC134015110 [Osmerus eperlanus]|uniref:uncharacterized protein LOC134015110 n=1 Tax=Osmerus eperlanus TaxID=29151 RepID=UPI002E118B6D